MDAGHEARPPSTRRLLGPLHMLRVRDLTVLAPGRQGSPGWPGTQTRLLAQNVQVTGWRLCQGLQTRVHILHAEALLRFSLPAASHDGVDIRGAGARPLQLPALRDALDCLRQGRDGEESKLRVSGQEGHGISQIVPDRLNCMVPFKLPGSFLPRPEKWG